MKSFYILLVLVLTAGALKAQDSTFYFDGLFFKNDSTIELDEVINFSIQRKAHHMDDIIIVAPINMMKDISRVIVTDQSFHIIAFNIVTDSSYIDTVASPDWNNNEFKTTVINMTDPINCESEVRIEDFARTITIDRCMKRLIAHALVNKRPLYLFFSITTRKDLLNLNLTLDREWCFNR